jgi:diaminopimelate decarboxylase
LSQLINTQLSRIAFMPMSLSFEERLLPRLPIISDHFGTPFHIYDECGIVNTGREMLRAFQDIKFREYFAVKALPNPAILELMLRMGYGFDCSSLPEIALARMVGAVGEEVMFTSNNTSEAELEAATAFGCILNLDDITMIDKVVDFPELVCFRYNPGHTHNGCELIGNPLEAKFGLRDDQIVEGYRLARERGARRFGLHTMVCSNELDYTRMLETARMLLRLVERIEASLNITFDFINLGGGIGIPYRPEEKPFDLVAFGRELKCLLDTFAAAHGGRVPKILLESGRYMTGPHGVLVARVINRMEKWRTYIGVDASMSALMRPALYEQAHHHITVLNKQRAEEIVDVVGSVCENSDKFARQRLLPVTEEGDILLIHDTGAHGHAMGFNYNGRLRPRELLLREDGTVVLIRREETEEDYFATLRFEPKKLARQDYELHAPACVS